MVSAKDPLIGWGCFSISRGALVKQRAVGMGDGWNIFTL